MQLTTWTLAVTSTRSWICITRCSAHQCALSTCHTWETRWDALNAAAACEVGLSWRFWRMCLHVSCPPPPPQVCQVSAQQPVQTELLMRYHQLQSRLATLKIENEEVRIYDVLRVWPATTFSPTPPKNREPCLIFPRAGRRATSPSVLIAITLPWPLSAGAKNIFRLSQCQCYVFLWSYR